MVALRLTIVVGSQCQRLLDAAPSYRRIGFRHYCDVFSSTVASRCEEVGSRRGHGACELRGGPLGNRHLVQHRGWDRSGRGVHDLVNVLASHVDFNDHSFGSRIQPELRCVVVGDATKFAGDQ